MKDRRRDHYHQRSKREGYRSRAAYKLLEMQRAHRLLAAGQRVVDVGCWPGAWLQVASEIVGPSGRIVGVDLAVLDPPFHRKNTCSFQGDISKDAVVEEIVARLGGPADVVLSDAAPKLTGVRATDRAREEALLEAVEVALPRLLRPGGTLLVKLLDCPEAQAFEKRIRFQFASALLIRPRASRKGTTERYLLSRGYRGGGRSRSA